ncbi:hypothetical protein vBEcoMWL3_gp186c [Escherichia phage vB_EcoM_WL-3]|nr:hypothetical protein vBEcoMWL3_gp186c [Escherichia phage vB_EcoM_WL-3]
MYVLVATSDLVLCPAEIFSPDFLIKSAVISLTIAILFLN